MTPEEITRLEELAKKATPGNWIARSLMVAVDDGAGIAHCGLGIRTPDYVHEQESNAAYIAAANPTTILFLLSSLREKDREIRELKNEVITIDEALQVAVLARDQWEVKNKSAESRLSTLIERSAQVAKEKGSLLQKTNAYRGHISVQVAADYCNEIATDIRNLGKEGK